MKKGAGTRKIIIKFLVTVILILIAAGAYIYVQDTRLEDITVEGNSHYTDAELLKLIFPGEDDRQTLKVWWNELKGEHHDIPFVSRYEITLTGLRSAEIMVYEKNIVACLEYMGSIMYFDKDGIVVESAATNTEGVPLITGIMFSQIVMHEPIKTENERIFTTVLNLTQLLAKNRLNVDKVYYDGSLNARLYMDTIRVELGNSDYLDEKVLELKAILPNLEGMSGTLYLDTYDPDVVNPQYRFKPDKD